MSTTLRAEAPEFYFYSPTAHQTVGYPCSTTLCSYNLPGISPFTTVHYTYGPTDTIVVPLYETLPLNHILGISPPLQSFPPPPPPPPPPTATTTTTFYLVPCVEKSKVEKIDGVKKALPVARSRKEVMKGGEYEFVRRNSSSAIWKQKEESAVIENMSQTAPIVKIEKPKVFADEPITPSGKKTTVMIKNIPNKYTRKMLLEFLDDHCVEENLKLASSMEKPSAYDFVYLPIDFETECNKGYAFVNFTEPIAAWRLHSAMNDHNWGILRSKKICKITYARIQGLEALKKQFEQRSFMCDEEEYLPVYFEPYRDGPGKLDMQFIVGKCLSLPSSTPQDSA